MANTHTHTNTHTHCWCLERSAPALVTPSADLSFESIHQVRILKLTGAPPSRHSRRCGASKCGSTELNFGSRFLCILISFPGLREPCRRKPITITALYSVAHSNFRIQFLNNFSRLLVTQKITMTLDQKNCGCGWVGVVYIF